MNAANAHEPVAAGHEQPDETIKSDEPVEKEQHGKPAEPVGEPANPKEPAEELARPEEPVGQSVAEHLSQPQDSSGPGYPTESESSKLGEPDRRVGGFAPDRTGASEVSASPNAGLEQVRSEFDGLANHLEVWREMYNRVAAVRALPPAVTESGDQLFTIGDMDYLVTVLDEGFLVVKRERADATEVGRFAEQAELDKFLVWLAADALRMERGDVTFKAVWFRLGPDPRVTITQTGATRSTLQLDGRVETRCTLKTPDAIAFSHALPLSIDELDAVLSRETLTA